MEKGTHACTRTNLLPFTIVLIRLLVLLLRVLSTVLRGLVLLLRVLPTVLRGLVLLRVPIVLLRQLTTVLRVLVVLLRVLVVLLLRVLTTILLRVPIVLLRVLTTVLIVLLRVLSTVLVILTTVLVVVPASIVAATPRTTFQRGFGGCRPTLQFRTSGGVGGNRTALQPLVTTTKVLSREETGLSETGLEPTIVPLVGTLSPLVGTLTPTAVVTTAGGTT